MFSHLSSGTHLFFDGMKKLLLCLRQGSCEFDLSVVVVAGLGDFLGEYFGVS